jgi:hypothetical protein
LVVCAAAEKPKAIATIRTKPAFFMAASLSSQQNRSENYL